MIGVSHEQTDNDSRHHLRTGTVFGTTHLLGIVVSYLGKLDVCLLSLHLSSVFRSASIIWTRGFQAVVLRDITFDIHQPTPNMVAAKANSPFTLLTLRQLADRKLRLSSQVGTIEVEKPQTDLMRPISTSDPRGDQEEMNTYSTKDAEAT